MAAGASLACDEFFLGPGGHQLELGEAVDVGVQAQKPVHHLRKQPQARPHKARLVHCQADLGTAHEGRKRLARQVRQPDQLLALAPALALDYANDEVGQLAAAFDDALGMLRHALKREQLFTSDVSHELRTPLMVLASSCELLQENPSLDTRGRAQVQRVARASEEMRELVQTFLLLARDQGDAAAMAVQSTLAVVADELAQQWRQPMESKGLQFIYQQSVAGTQRYHAVFLRTVLGNLLRNAWHYTNSGHITLRVDDQGFTVEDTGVGIPESEREAIFERVPLRADFVAVGSELFFNVG